MTWLRARRDSRLLGERGVSLIELLIAITITGIISGALVGAIFFGFRATGATETRLEQSNKANILASYYVEDVQNASGVSKGVAESTAACGAGASTVGLLLTLDTVTPSLNSISYFQGAGANSTTLYRRTCTGGTPSVSIPVIHGLKPGTLKFDCSPFNPATGACVNPSPNNGTPDWTSVTVTLTQQDSNKQYLYPTSIVATKRVS